MVLGREGNQQWILENVILTLREGPPGFDLDLVFG